MQARPTSCRSARFDAFNMPHKARFPTAVRGPLASFRLDGTVPSLRVVRHRAADLDTLDACNCKFLRSSKSGTIVQHAVLSRWPSAHCVANGVYEAACAVLLHLDTSSTTETATSSRSRQRRQTHAAFSDFDESALHLEYCIFIQ